MSKNNKIVFHIDVNSAFLSWEAVKRLKEGDTVDLRTIPSVIGGDENSRHGVVLAKSIEAQKFGIKTGEPLYFARQKCKTLTVAPSNFPYYSSISSDFFKFLRDYSPVVEQFSIDEGFLDYSIVERIHGEPVSAAHKLKDEIFEKFGFTVNIGVAPNKILAKMAGELKKPNLVHTIFSDEVEAKLWGQPVRNLFMVGEKSEKALNLNGINTIGDLAKASPELISKLLKSHGMMIWRYANGIDSSPVVSNFQTSGKSYSNSVTLSQDLTDIDQSNLIFLQLAQSVAMRIRQDNLLCSTITIQIKYSDFSMFSKQMHIKTPTDSTEEIYEYAKKLFKALWDKTPIRLLGLGLADLSEQSDMQISIFENLQSEKQKKLDSVCDKIRNQFGNHSISYGAELTQEDTGYLDRFFPNNVKKEK